MLILKPYWKYTYESWFSKYSEKTENVYIQKNIYSKQTINPILMTLGLRTEFINALCIVESGFFFGI